MDLEINRTWYTTKTNKMRWRTIVHQILNNIDNKMLEINIDISHGGKTETFIVDRRTWNYISLESGQIHGCC